MGPVPAGCCGFGVHVFESRLVTPRAPAGKKNNFNIYVLSTPSIFAKLIALDKIPVKAKQLYQAFIENYPLE